MPQASTKKRKRTGRQVACKWCEQEMNSFAMSVHLQHQCEMIPRMEDAGDMKAGTTVNEGTGMSQKIAHTWSSLEKDYPKDREGAWMRFISPRTCPVTVNGLTVYLTEGIEAYIPRPHYDILMDSIASDRDVTSPRQFSDVVARRGADLQVVGRGPILDY